MCDTYNCDYLQHNTFRFNLIDFQLKQISLPNFTFFKKLPSVTQKWISQENAFKKSKKSSAFFLLLLLLLLFFSFLFFSFLFFSFLFFSFLFFSFLFFSFLFFSFLFFSFLFFSFLFFFFFRKTIGSNNSDTLIENNSFWVLEISCCTQLKIKFSQEKLKSSSVRAIIG